MIEWKNQQKKVVFNHKVEFKKQNARKGIKTSFDQMIMAIHKVQGLKNKMPERELRLFETKHNVISTRREV